MVMVEAYIKEKLLAKNDKYLFAYKKGCLILRNAETREILSKKRIHGRLKSFTLIERLLRYEPRVAVVIDSDTFMYSDHGAIYRYDVVQNNVSKIHSFGGGMNNPLSFCVRHNEDGNLVELLYGEYAWNTKKEAVSIYRYNMRTWKKVYSFQAGTITHIHNIFYDNYKKRYLIVTGDDDKESALWEADEEFCDVKIVCGGSQKYRACMVLTTNKGVYYATDTPLEQNYIYYLDENKLLHEVYRMPGPCIYGTIWNECLYMATSVEGDPTLVGWQYRLSNKLGKGVNDRNVHIIKCDREGNVTEVASFRKDFLPMWLFQFGNAQFPSANDGVYVSTQSTVEKGTYKLNEE